MNERPVAVITGATGSLGQVLTRDLSAAGYDLVLLGSNRPRAGMSAYAVGKAALEALFATLAAELRGTGVTANVVRVRTIDSAHVRDTDRHLDQGAPSTNKVDWTTPEEISAAIRYLFSDAARVVNGEALGLHRGYMAT